MDGWLAGWLAENEVWSSFYCLLRERKREREERGQRFLAILAMTRAYDDLGILLQNCVTSMGWQGMGCIRCWPSPAEWTAPWK